MDNGQCAAAFDQELTEYFRDASDCEDCLNATTVDVCPWPQLPACVTTLPNMGAVAELALSTNALLQMGKFPDGVTTCYKSLGCALCDGKDSCFDNAVIVGLNAWVTSAITSFAEAFVDMVAFNQVSSALNACAWQLRYFCLCSCRRVGLPRCASGRCGCRAHGAGIVCPCAVAAFN